MSRAKEQKDTALKYALAGRIDTLSIEEGYFERERLENMAEQGYRIPRSKLPEPRSVLEIAIFKSDKDMEHAEGDRVNRVIAEYPQDEPEDRPITINNRTIERL